MPTQSEIRAAYLERLDAHLAAVAPRQALDDLRSERARVENAMAWLSRMTAFDDDGDVSFPGGLDFGWLSVIDGDLAIRIGTREEAQRRAA